MLKPNEIHKREDSLMGFEGMLVDLKQLVDR